MENKELWTERYDRHQKTISSNTERIESLEQFRVGTEKQIKHLIDSLNSLTKTMRWFMGLIIGSFVAFFFYFVQSLI